MNQESSPVNKIAVGKLQIGMISPEPQIESTERISFWWGLTCSSLALARHIESELTVAGKDLLELGCGIGLTGLAASLQGARVTFSDYVPEALDTAKSSAIANGAPMDTVRFLNLDWESPVHTGLYDIIIGSEVVYDYFFHSSLLELINNALKPNGVLIIADRERLVVNRFIGRLLRQGYSCSKRNYLVNDKGFPIQDITVYELQRP